MNFELGDQIGKGNTGTVYFAKQIGLDRDLAVKFIHPALVADEEAINLLLKEAALSAKLNHPNIVRVLDAGRDDTGRPYVVMEYLEGESFRARISRGKLPEKLVIEAGKQILSGLGAAHAQGAIHRDLKPSNIFLTSAGVVKILDFGIARALATGAQVGTPEYTSPEVAEGQKIDSRADLYSLGIILYEMLTGAVPFTAETPMGVLYKQVHERVPEVPKGTALPLHTTIVCLLRKSPKQRIQSAAQALEMLEGGTGKKVKPPIPVSKQDNLGWIMHPATSDRPAPEVVTQSGVVKSARPVRRVSKIAVAAIVLVLVAAAVFIGNGVAPTVEDFIVARTGLNLSLRISPGQKFRVVRQQSLTLGAYQIQTSDEGTYTAKTVIRTPLEVIWTTKRDKSLLQIGKWKKAVAASGASSSTWPNKPGAKDSGWALSPLTLDSGKLHTGEGGETKSGLQWRLDSTVISSGRKIAKIAFTNLPKGNILLDSNYIDAVAGRIKAAKNDDEWAFPKAGWKTTRIEDQIDASTGIPSSIEIEQTHPGGFKFKSKITMTPSGN